MMFFLQLQLSYVSFTMSHLHDGVFLLRVDLLVDVVENLARTLPLGAGSRSRLAHEGRHRVRLFPLSVLGHHRLHCLPGHHVVNLKRTKAMKPKFFSRVDRSILNHKARNPTVVSHQSRTIMQKTFSLRGRCDRNTSATFHLVLGNSLGFRPVRTGLWRRDRGRGGGRRTRRIYIGSLWASSGSRTLTALQRLTYKCADL